MGTCDTNIEIASILGAGKEACVLLDATKTDCDDSGMQNDCAESFGCQVDWENKVCVRKTPRYGVNRGPVNCTDE
jgi:hypothetical protein